MQKYFEDFKGSLLIKMRAVEGGQFLSEMEAFLLQS